MNLAKASIKKVSVRVFSERKNIENTLFLPLNFVFSILISLISIVKFTRIDKFYFKPATATYILSLVVLTTLMACKVNYSFTGASIAEDVKTISVKQFQNFAPLANVNYSQTFSEALKDIFISQTNLSLVASNGDLQFEGSITNYQITSVAIQGNETAAKNRLTITVKVKFTNTKDKKQNFETDFTRFTDYDSSVNLSSIEDGLIKEINDQLTQDIFNKSVGSW